MARAPISGFDYFNGIRNGTIEPPPMPKLFGIEIVEVEAGHIALTATPRPEHNNPMGITHGGYAAVCSTPAWAAQSIRRSSRVRAW